MIHSLNWSRTHNYHISYQRRLNALYPIFFSKISFTLYPAHSRQRRQREPSVKTLCFPLSAEFWRHCILSGGTQRRCLPRHQSEEMKINVNKYHISSSGDRTLRHDWSHYLFLYDIIFNMYYFNVSRKEQSHYHVLYICHTHRTKAS